MAKRKSDATGPISGAPAAGVDFMALGAHPDDVELGCGGTLLKLVSLGRKGVIVDLTDASMGTRGTPEIRAREDDTAAKALCVAPPNPSLPTKRPPGALRTVGMRRSASSTPSGPGGRKSSSPIMPAKSIPTTRRPRAS